MTTWRRASLTVGQSVKKKSYHLHLHSCINIKVFMVYTLYVSFLCLTFREFMPSLDEFFAEAIEQADPANMVEDEYK